MAEVSVRNQTIGGDSPAYIIAEAGINHNGSLQLAKELIDIALEADADAVKFQKRELDRTYVEEVYDDPSISEMGVEYTLSNLKDVSLSDEEFRELAAYCHGKDIEFLSSPWDAESVDFLQSLDLPLYKIGSPDMTNFVLLERLIETGKPLVLSTGMADEAEIERTTEFLEEQDAEYALMHCRSTYPAPYHNLNLEFMERLDAEYDVPVGYSGHERGIAVSEAAVAMGADMLERHFTVDRTMDGPDHAASLEPAGLKKLVRDVRNIETSFGTASKYITRGEYNNRVALGKSLVAADDIETGVTIDREDLTAKSPAKGISPQYLYDVVGNTAVQNIEAGSILQWDDIRESNIEKFDTSLDNWGVVVRFSDIVEQEWGNPDVYEFRLNGADIEADIDSVLSGHTFDKRLGIHAPEQKGHNIVDLSSRVEAKRKEAVEVIQSVIDLVRETIVPHFELETEPQIVIHPGGITKDHMETDAVPAMNAALEKSIRELDDDGVQCLLENMPPLPWIYGGQQYHNNFMRADEIAEFCERTGTKICYDTSHAKLWCNYTDKDLVKHARQLRPYIEYLHVADAAGVDGEGLQIGDGEIDFEAIGHVFDGYEGPIITEIWRGHERNGEGFKKAAERLTQHF